MSLNILSPSEQVANHLRDLLTKGRWQREFPGTPALSTELEVDRKTIITAIKQLEDEGLLKSQGTGRPRLVIPPKKTVKTHLNIRLMPYEEDDRQRPYIMDLVPQIQKLGHDIIIDRKTLNGLGMDSERVARHVEAHPADAWIMLSASAEILEWLAKQDIPAMAVFGRRRKVPIASIGPDKTSALRACVRRLVELGHSRIVLLVREERRLPTPGYLEQQFLQELEANGITPGSFHLPDWKEDVEGFHECIDKLFMYTPPTALIFDEAQFYVAAQQHLSRMNLSAPRDISLASCDTHPIFEWCQPKISHIHWDIAPVVNHVAHWVSQLTRGINKRVPSYTSCDFIEGGTIGPVPR